MSCRNRKSKGLQLICGRDKEICHVPKATTCYKVTKTTNPEPSAVLSGSITWNSVNDILPDPDTTVLVYRNTSRFKLAFQVITWWNGDEGDYTHWATLTRPQ